MTISDEEFMRQVLPKNEEIVLWEAVVHSGQIYKLNFPLPGSGEATRIVRMFEQEDGAIVIYYLATAKDSKMGYIRTLSPMALLSTTKMSYLNVWKADLMEMVKAEREGEEEDVCPNCETVIENENATNCPNCGALLDEPETTTAVVEPPIPPPPPPPQPNGLS